MNAPYAEVIGDPISHSKSPLIHNFWLEKLGLNASYRHCHVRPEELADYFAERRGDADWRGCNVTIPHKEAVIPFLDHLEDAAKQVGATNTIWRDAEGQLTGTNTDVDGILAALPEELMPPGSQVCILGTGGAARAALAACKRRNISVVLMSARNQDAAKALMEEFRLGGAVRAIDDAENIQTAEVIVNATSLGMTGKSPMPRALLDHLRNPLPDIAVFDMVYSPLETELLRTAGQAGCHTVDGLVMLVGQARTAFERFFGAAAPSQYDAELRVLLTS